MLERLWGHVIQTSTEVCFPTLVPFRIFYLAWAFWNLNAIPLPSGLGCPTNVKGLVYVKGLVFSLVLLGVSGKFKRWMLASSSLWGQP